MIQLISIGQIIDQTWEHYHKKFRELFSISAWLFVPCIISIISMVFYPKATTLLANNSFSFTEISSLVVWFINNAILNPIIGLWVFLMTVRLLCTHWEKRGVKFGNIMKEGWKLFVPAVLINVLVAIILFSFWLLIVPGPIIGFLGEKININFISQFGVLLTFAGILAAFVLTVEWAVYLAYAPMVLVIEDLRDKEILELIRGRLLSSVIYFFLNLSKRLLYLSELNHNHFLSWIMRFLSNVIKFHLNLIKILLRSSELIHGRYWSGIVRFLLPKLVFLIVLLVAEGIIIFLVNLAISYLTGLNTELAATLTNISTTLFMTIGAVLINPLVVTSDFLLFESLRNTFRK